MPGGCENLNFQCALCIRRSRLPDATCSFLPTQTIWANRCIKVTSSWGAVGPPAPTFLHFLLDRLGLQEANLQQEPREVVDAVHPLDASIPECHEKCAGKVEDPPGSCQSAEFPDVRAAL